MSDAISPCPACGSDASTEWYASGLFGIAGWTTDCNYCTSGPRVTRLKREESREAWNRLVNEYATDNSDSADSGSNHG